MTKKKLTNDQIVDKIDNGGYWYNSSYAVANNITYNIPTNSDWFANGYTEKSGWNPLNTKQKKSSEEAMKNWDDVIALKISKSIDPNLADIRVNNSTTGVNYAHSYYPGQADADKFDYEKSQGSIWLNSKFSTLTDPDMGEYGYMSIMHEIGHSLGLSHPGNYNGGRPSYEANADFQQDTQMYTIMSYFDASKTGADWVSGTGKKYFAQTPMVYDVLTSQKIYGANYKTRSGNTTYGFNSTNRNSVFDFSFNKNPILTIWDGGGTDTLDVSKWNTNSAINLTPGTYSDTNNMKKNIAIAFNTYIDNVVGGGGDDIIKGNKIDNIITGGLGDDTISGGLGNDTAKYKNNRSDYTLTKNLDKWDIYGPEGHDILSGIEYLSFADQDISLLDVNRLTAITQNFKIVFNDIKISKTNIEKTNYVIKLPVINYIIISNNILTKVDRRLEMENGKFYLYFNEIVSKVGRYLKLVKEDFSLIINEIISKVGRYLKLDNASYIINTKTDTNIITESNIIINEVNYPTGYGYSQDQGTAIIFDNGDGISLNNNAWKKIEINKEISPDTVLSFEFKSDKEGEIHGIGFDNNNVLSGDLIFKLHGTQNWGLKYFDNQYTSGSGYKKYRIPVGGYYSGFFKYMVFVMDDDKDLGGDSSFKNIKLMDIKQDIPVNKILSYGKNQDHGKVTILSDGGIKLTENAWKKIQIPFYMISADTVLSFEFKSDKEGEIHGIGFDTNDYISHDLSFKLHGTQNWGLKYFDNQYVTGSGYKKYDIPIGSFYTGFFDRVILIMDDDRYLGADSVFKNITLSTNGEITKIF